MPGLKIYGQNISCSRLTPFTLLREFFTQLWLSLQSCPFTAAQPYFQVSLVHSCHPICQPSFLPGTYQHNKEDNTCFSSAY